MIFAKDLILKGVAGLAVVGGLGAGGIYVWNKRKEESLQFLTEKVGLECTAGTPNETTGVQCNKKNGSDVKVKVKQGSTNIEVATISTGKIKVYKAGDSKDYNGGFKFVIEEADISASNPSTSKLEQFETYEIKQEGGDWRLTRKYEANVGKEKALGLPTGCKLPSTTSTSTTCNDVVLDVGKLKLINFEGKGSTESLNVPDDANLKLTITKLTDSDTEFPNGGYKFVFKTDKDINIPKSSTGNITLKAKTNPEFKIKKATTGNGLTLEKAWTANNLGAKVGLNCPAENNTDKECTLTDNKVNVNNGNGGNNKFQNLSKKGEGEKKVKFEEDKEGYNQGFKFYVEGSDDICLQANGTSGDDANKKIESKGSTDVSYEIKQEETTWYLIKKTPAPAA